LDELALAVGLGFLKNGIQLAPDSGLGDAKFCGRICQAHTVAQPDGQTGFGRRQAEEITKKVG
jgi:hypothetical protein